MDFLSQMNNLISERKEVNAQRIQLDSKERKVLSQQRELLKENFKFLCEVDVYYFEEDNYDGVYIYHMDTYQYDVDMMATYLVASNTKEAIENLLEKEGVANPTWLK